MDLVKKFENLEEFIAKNDLTSEVKGICDDNDKELSVPTSKELQEWFKNHEVAGKKLHLGIIGRVKAGKSSLLNAIFFDGKDILPKAATPMTAALTILDYDTNLQAKADFFSEADIANLKEKHEYYKKEFSKKVESKIQELKEIARKKNIDKDESELKQNAQMSVERDMKRDENFASFDQYEKIITSGLKPADIKSDINASNLEDLKDVLKDYVGESGKFMPFTKSITLSFDTPILKDMLVVDSPGINDPITSREERTRQLLKDCDAVFLISPAGQFVSEEDFNLLDRISDKEGISEFTIIASQADNQLFGSAKDKTNGILSKANECNKQDLSEQLKKTILQFKAQHSSQNAKNTCDRLANSQVILSSAACFSILKNFNDKSSWDSNMQKVWENLTLEYKDFFSDENTAKENLKLLANIDKIKERLEEVRANKQQILENKKNEYMQAKIKTLQDYTSGIEKIIHSRIDELEKKDLTQISNQIKEINGKTDTTILLDEEYENLYIDFIMGLKDELNTSKKAYFKEGKESIRDNQSTGSESYQTKEKRGGIFGSIVDFFDDGRTVTKTREFTIIRAGDVRYDLEDMISNLQDLLNDKIKERSIAWKKTLFSKLVGVFREHLGDDNLDHAKVTRIIKNIVNSIPTPNVDYNDALPSHLKRSGQLKGYEAERYIDEAVEFVSNFSTQVNSDIGRFILDLEKTLKSIKIADDIVKNYKEELGKLENELKNKKLSIDKYKKMLKDLKIIMEAENE